ncbi:DsrE family protein [Pseudorhodoplanes sinuspersici]|nr:DsrE family protein [Pseudorhodoplanes sinuspersici]RKE71044.1 putative peroxiredoxin [Pseudorhodoplanes sinuspersici]
MTRVAMLIFGIALGFAATNIPVHRMFEAVAQTPSAKPALFVNMTTGDTWRGWMGLHFAHNTMKQGHQVTIFLNLDGVKLATKAGEQEKRPSMQRVPRDIVADFIKDGGKVLICGPCLSEFGLRMEDLVAGVELGKPGYTQSFIFAENAKTLTW